MWSYEKWEIIVLRKGHTMIQINGKRLIDDIDRLGGIGLDEEGKRTRTAATDADKAGRDVVCAWMREAGMQVTVDRVGNIFGVWDCAPEDHRGTAPLMLGSHIDTVINAGKYDGCLGVLAGIEVVRTMQENEITPDRPIVVAAFTNEEGVRYAPDMLGSLVFAGGIDADEALAVRGIDGTALGEELSKIGYAGESCDLSVPCAFIELHIEQGPILDRENIPIGAVEDLQGIAWYEITVTGHQNHAGTTPTHMRYDAGLAAAKINVFLRKRCEMAGSRTVATVGTCSFEPNAVNVIPGKAVFTVDLRNPDEACLQAEEQALTDYLKELEQTDQVRITARRVSRFEPVVFDQGIVEKIESAARLRGLSCRRMTSGAGQDAQNLATICPTAMIFVPSVGGISHDPEEYTRDQDIINGANILLDIAVDITTRR